MTAAAPGTAGVHLLCRLVFRNTPARIRSTLPFSQRVRGWTWDTPKFLRLLPLIAQRPALVRSARLVAYCSDPSPVASGKRSRGARPFKVWFYLICLRSQCGQNGQILFISGEQLSLIVAGDSAETLSVLGNMGDALDDCGLRFAQKCRRPPQNTPDLGGPTDFFRKVAF